MSDTQDLKEDFSGLTEHSDRTEHTEHQVKDPQHQPEDLPPRIDVSEEIEKANAKSKNEQESSRGQPQLESFPYPPPGMFPPGMFPPPPQQQKPSFWKSLMTRGLTILAVVAVGLLVWWWWSSNKSVGEAAAQAAQAATDAAQAAAKTVQENVVKPVKRALNLPPHL